MIRKSLLAIAAAALCSSAYATDTPVSVPNTFQANAPAKAADVNANFQALVTAINALTTRVASLESSNTTNTSAISTLQSQVSTLQSNSGGNSGSGTPTLATLAGTYTLLQLVSGASGNSSASPPSMGVSAGINTISLTLTSDGKFSFSGVSSNKTNASVTLGNYQCSAPMGTIQCNGNNGSVSASQNSDSNDSGTGTWSYSNGVLTVTPGESGAPTILFQLLDPTRTDGGRAAFAVVIENNGSNGTGADYELDMVIRAPAT